MHTITRYILNILIVTVCVMSSLSLNAQEVKSTDIQTINGRKFYIHKVAKGQSLYAISRIYGVDVNYILADNDEAIDGLKTGQELKIPFPVEQPMKPQAIDTNKYVYHKVAKGETLYSIAKKYNKTEKHLVDLNPGLTSSIREGQYIALYEKVNKIKPHIIVVKKDSVPALDTTITTKEKKQAYTIGLFLPFKLAESETINVEDYVRSNTPFPALPSIAVDFYMGFKKVADSLSAKGFEVNLQLFDTDDRDSARIENVCKTADFKNLDLIIGPLYASSFKMVAQHARKASIPIVAPLTQQSKILYNNPLASKVNPSQFTLIEGLADYCVDSLMAGSNIVIVNNGYAKDQQYLKTFKLYYNSRLTSKGKTMKDSIVEVKGLSGVKSAFVPGRKNVVVLLTSNQVFLADFITQLYVYADKKDIVLLGFNSVSEIENIDQEYLNKLQFHFATPTGVNYADSTTLRLIHFYREIMNTDPTSYFFEGYDIGWYMLNHLKQQGPSFFLQLDKYPAEGIYTRFNFYHPDASTGFENKAVYIYRYEDYTLKKTGWKP